MSVLSPRAEGLIFDLDGTLADTMPLHFEAWAATFAAYGLAYPGGLVETRSGVPTRVIVELYNRQFGRRLDVEAFTRAKERRARERLHGAQPIAPIVAIARANRGRLPMAVATGGVRENAGAILAAVGLDGVFDAVVTADDAVAPKPAPDIFLEAARRIGVRPQACQVFEDADPGLEAARAAGMIATDVRPLLAAITKQSSG